MNVILLLTGDHAMYYVLGGHDDDGDGDIEASDYIS